MNYYYKFINDLTNSLSIELDLSEEKKEIIAYAIETLILTILGFLLILGISLLFNAIIPATIAAICGGLLRRVSGGAHFNNPFKCLFFGAIVYSLIGVITNKIILIGINTNYLSLILMIISLLIVVLYAPVDSIAKPIHSKKFKSKLKFASAILVFGLFIFVNFINNNLVITSIALGITYQSVTLLPLLNKKEV